MSVLGLGYVGAVSCACLAHDGFDVTGVDLSPEKTRLINAGKSPIVEQQLGELIAEGVAAGRLRGSGDGFQAVRGSTISLISVGTPSQPNGALDLTAVERVAETVGRGIAGKAERHLVVVRSTVLPGTVRTRIVPLIERYSGKTAGSDFGVCFNPEFLRESSSVRDYYNPPYTLVGSDAAPDGEAVASLYRAVQAPVIHCGIETAELVKYASNAFHALKVTFANEMGMLAQATGVDGFEVMSLLCRDTKLNISAHYLRPGFAFGGSCLPKDVRALVQRARESDLELPLLAAILGSNRVQIDRAVQLILGQRKKRVGVFGLSFKAGSDDLRESPMVSVTEALIGKGCQVRIYDADIQLARLTGANKQFIERELPHLAQLMGGSVREVADHAEVLVLGNGSPALAELPALCRAGQTIIDLAGHGPATEGFRRRGDLDYHGIAW